MKTNVYLEGILVVYDCSKDVRLPQKMQRAMAAEAEATREARAKVGSLCSCPTNNTSSGNSVFVSCGHRYSSVSISVSMPHLPILHTFSCPNVFLIG